MANNYKKGSWSATCDVCGFDFEAEKLLLRWDGMRVCKEDFETRHPQDFLRAKPEKAPPPWTRPSDTESAITIYETNQSISATLTGDLLWYFDTSSGALTATLPTANNSTFKGISVVYAISNYDTTASASVTVASSSTIVGSVTVRVGTTGRFRNVPGDNLWIRES